MHDRARDAAQQQPLQRIETPGTDRHEVGIPLVGGGHDSGAGVLRTLDLFGLGGQRRWQPLAGLGKYGRTQRRAPRASSCGSVELERTCTAGGVQYKAIWSRSAESTHPNWSTAANEPLEPSTAIKTFIAWAPLARTGETWPAPHGFYSTPLAMRMPRTYL